MTNERIECIPSLATPKPLPRPEPFHKATFNLDLTPEKKPNVPTVRVDNELAVPTLNSTAKTQLQIEKLKRKKRTTVPQVDPTLTQCVKSNVLKVVSNDKSRDYVLLVIVIYTCIIIYTYSNRQSTSHLTLDYTVISHQ